MNILYISNSLPYNSVRHAGGKTFNYYVKYMSTFSDCNIKVVGFCKENELKEIDANKSNLEIFPIITKGGAITNVKRVLTDLYGKILKLPECDNSYFKYKHILKYIKRISFKPNVVILEWTNIVLLCDEIKKYFPYAKIIASEHDVNFLGLYRKYEINRDCKSYVCYKKEKEAELMALSNCDIVYVQNEKDKKLLIENNIMEESIKIISPFYHDMSSIRRKDINKDLLFWGAMYRPENYEAAIWFIQNVMPLLSDVDVRFVVAGNKPPKQLKELEGDKVVITGFVDDETELFEHSLCFVSPLLTGAGIKVKIIEALSSGIPVLTNGIGIEGIPAKKGLDYYHCDEPEDYNYVIRKLLENKEDKKCLISRQNFIKNDYNLIASAQNYKKTIEDIRK